MTRVCKSLGIILKSFASPKRWSTNSYILEEIFIFKYWFKPENDKKPLEKLHFLDSLANVIFKIFLK